MQNSVTDAVNQVYEIAYLLEESEEVAPVATAASEEELVGVGTLKFVEPPPFVNVAETV